MEIKLTQKTPVMVQVEVELPWENVESSYKKALKEIAGMVAVPGFRKGKAPAAMVKKKFREDITNSVARATVPEQIPEIIKKESLKAVGEPQISHFSLKEKQSFSFEFFQEVKPEIELKDWKGIEVDSLKTEVTDEMVEDRIESILKAHTNKEEIKDRPAEEGETIKFQMSILDDESKDLFYDENHIEVLNDKFPFPTIKEKLMSEQGGEDIEMDFTPGDDFEIEEARGRNVKLYIEIQSITKEVTPELNDEFAKHEGCDDVEAWRKKVRDDLVEQNTNMEKQRVHAILMDKILEDYNFEIPMSMVYSTLQFMANNEIGPYINYIQDENQKQQMIDHFFKSRAAGAERVVRFDLILEKLAETENLVVEDQELKEKLEEVSNYIPENQRESIDFTDLESDIAGRVREDLLNQKAKDTIYDAAKITWVDKLPEPEPEPEVEPEHVEAADTEAAGSDEQTKETEE